MEIGLIIGMTGIGVGTAVAEKVLNSIGKTDLANFVSIAGLSGLGLTAVGLICKLLQSLSTLAVK